MALDLEDIELPIKDDVEIFVMYVSDTEKNYAATLVQNLRMSGFRVESEYTGRGLKAQFKQADRLKAKYLIILNDEDLAKNEIKVKNNKTKEEITLGLDYLLYYFDEALLEDDMEYVNNDECDCDDCESHSHECHCNHEEE